MKRPWMPLYIADYLADTAHLTAAEHGAYLLLLMHLWANGILPSWDSQKLRLISKMTPKQWISSKDTLQAFFYDGWKHKRVEEEMAKAERFSEAGSKAGKVSAAKRKAKSANGSATIVQRNSNGSGNETATTEQQTSNDPSTLTVTVTKNLESESVAAREGLALRKRIVKIYLDLGLEPVPEMGLAEAWIAQGYNPDICAAVVADRLRTQKRLLPLAYFDRAIQERHERATTLNAQPQPSKAADPDERTQHLLAKTWLGYLANGEETWPIETPAPGKPGCKIAPEILRQHGIDPESGKRLQVQTS